MKKNLSILGSTGSIGTQTLDVVREHPSLFNVSAIAANKNDTLIEKQINEFEPDIAVLFDETSAKKLKTRYHGRTEILSGNYGLIEAATLSSVDTVVTSLMGFAGLAPTLAALNAKKNIALANKETLVVAGEIVMKKAKENGVSILPVDSEHCALFQCLQGEKSESIEKLILTASGGPFRHMTREKLQKVSINDCLNHPTWSMGKKITVDSATLVNKGLEVIEAHFLYDMPYEKIDVVVHPQSIIHSMVEFCDGAVMAQLGMPDMRLPIQYALTYPKRIASSVKKIDFFELSQLTFEKPDTDTFRGLKIAYEAGKSGGTTPCVMNGANEEAVSAFLQGKIGFLDIYDIIERALNVRDNKSNPSFEILCEEDRWARGFVNNFLESYK